MHRLPLADESADAELPACVECGVCCHFDDPRYVWVFEADSARMTEQDLALTHWVDGRCFMRVSDGHCAALSVKDGLHVCTIYERRPQLCRDFDRGCPECHAIRARGHGMRA